MLVFNPCNSPGRGLTTFACTYYQRLLHQLFAASSLGLLASDSAAFLTNVSATLAALDKGLHISSWGGVQEWKLQLAKATTSKTTRTGTCRTCEASTRAYHSRRPRPVPRQLRQRNHPARRRDRAVEPRARQRGSAWRAGGSGL